MVDQDPKLSKNLSNPSVPIKPFFLVVNALDLSFERSILVRQLQHAPLIIKGATS
jgi:hypothetical protein